MAGKLNDKDTKIDQARKLGEAIAQLALEKASNESSLIGIAIAITPRQGRRRRRAQARTGILAIYYMR